MELALSLGHETRKVPFSIFHEKSSQKELGFCMGLGKVNSCDSCDDDDDDDRNNNNNNNNTETGRVSSSSSDPPVQLDLLPSTPVHPSSNKFPFPNWLNQKLVAGDFSGKGEGEEQNSSPNCSATVSSSFQMDFSNIFKSTTGNIRKRSDFHHDQGNNIIINEDNSNNSRGGLSDQDDDENGTRKKLRLTKEQSAFLELSFKEHNTLNPKQKLGLAKQLNLRPRQVEVWFQNRRARTKLKQTEVDCEYLKRCCETLTEENKRLQKELHELRALKAAANSHPFYMQLPATTLTMCPSCERVAATTATGNAAVKEPTNVLSLSSNSQHDA